MLIHKVLSGTYPRMDNTDVSSFQGVGIDGSTIYRGVLISGS